MAEGAAHVRVRVTHARYEEEEERYASSESAKQRFWGPLIEIKRDRFPSSLTPEFFENTIRLQLPERIRERMSRFFYGSVGGEGEARSASTPVTVTISYMNYGSLDFGLMFEPIEKVATLFDSNFAYFHAFLQMYVPLELNEIIRFAPNGSSGPMESSFIGGLNYHVSVDPSMAAVLAGASKLAQPRAGGTPSMVAATADRARWAWIAANTSLLVPTALAAVYLYFANQDLQERERRRPAEYQALAQEQTKLLGTCGTLLARYVPPASAVHLP